MIIIEESFSLKSFNTFGIQSYARIFAEATTTEDLRSIIGIFKDNPLPKLVLGGGSNLLFTQDFDGIVFYPNLEGIELVKHSGESTWLRAYAGEKWDKFVEFCVSKNLGGLENLSHIPGNVGACPVQNIGAYGVEVKEAIDAVEAVDIATGDIRIFSNEECRFGYRDSIFKQEAKNKYIITSVVFKLRKQPAIFLTYKDVEQEMQNFPAATIASVRQAIINIRRRKLPDPEDLGNAGSFFKNPVITKEHFQTIKNNYPSATCFIVDKNLVKIPAAWLIENSGWKGKRDDNVGTHPVQPLVLVNYGGATGKEVIQFANKIQDSVDHLFGINLEIEVNVI